MSSWNVGRIDLAHMLERDHEIRPWKHDESPTALRVAIDGGDSVIHVPAHSAVRWRDDAVLVHTRGRVHVITARGEIVLSPEEEELLRDSWGLL